MVNICLWNKAAIIKLLWNIAEKKDSMWVRWLHVYYFKKKRCWEAATPKACSWNLKKILNFRDTIDKAGGWGQFINKGKFSIKKMYEYLCPQAATVPWARVITNNKGSPRSLFITWLAIQNRLHTKDRLLKWNMNCDPMCVLCRTHQETVHHLFFECTYSRKIWGRIMDILKISRQIKAWEEEVEWVIKKSRLGKSKHKLTIMCFCEAIYTIWLQRNSQVFKDCHVNDTQAVRMIIFRVSSRSNDEMRQMLLL